MRTKHLAIVIVALALGSATTVTVIGQQEPLPVVQPKQVDDAPLFEPPPPANEPTVFLASYPIVEYRAPTIEQAARNNDYVTFDALYREAVQRGEDVSAFATLHELWTWAISDPIGAFYGRDVYQRLTRIYPDYAEYIAEYSITDSNGNVYWPTSETRAFLLARAMAGEAPKTRLASVAPAAPAPRRESRSRRVAESQSDAARPVVKSASRRAVESPRVPARATAKIAPPISSAPMAPAVVISPVTETPIETAAVSPANAAAAPRVDNTPAVPADTAPAVPADTAPAVSADTAPAAPALLPQPRKSNALASRGILLLVLGLIGIGLLAVIFRTPKEEDEFVVVEPKPHAPVAPIRKQPAAREGETRATGSHG